ncbi:DUF3574 domain-containing protein [Variovorax sp. EBFNA2]|uniref:DUF3574 domain-containing protein n=1 Tax=Variovorax sp. EBFNA2 TaxID=3342097 RepID=UPI0029C05828|nr:DUF3574 domain-containing protein [Variovorax boronicumulans]WPG40511.1 DUF3574 domain-containing protein [Variovorax boronicumulans]
MSVAHYTLSRAGVAGALIAATLALAGCATSHSGNCAAGFDAFERDTLYFGRAIPTGGQVSDADWADFLDTRVTPAFPQGFTVIDAAGQWRAASGQVVREPSKLVVLLHPRDAKADAAIATLIDTYRQRFAQEAVLQERQSVCARF